MILARRVAAFFPLPGLINEERLIASQHGVLEDSTLEERIRLFDSRPRLKDEFFTISGSCRCFTFYGIR